MITSRRNGRGQLEVESLWLLSDREVAQFKRTGLRAEGGDRHRLAQVHHIIGASRVSERGSRIIRHEDGALLHASGDYIPSTAREDTRLWQYAESGAYLPVWIRRDARSVPAHALVPTNRAADDEPEYLDPQWQRETFARDVDAEIARIVDWKGALLDQQLSRGEPIAVRQKTTINLKVGASLDDAKDKSPTITNAESDSASEFLGFRWQDVTIPNGATYNSCTVSFACLSSTFDEPLHNVDFEDVDNANQFSNQVPNGANDRVLTGSPVLWDDTDLGVTSEGEFITTPDVSTPAAIVTSRAGWVSGNALVCIIVQPTTDANRDLGVRFYDENTAFGAELDVDFASAGGAVKRIPSIPHIPSIPSIGG